MIKITRLNSINESAPNLVIIPGGPGLSSRTLRSLDCLKENFNLLYIDFPGCNGNPYSKDHTFEELSYGVMEVVEKLKQEMKQKHSKVFILGHSFGGFFAADIALNTTVDGIICIATPFSNKSLHNANDNYSRAISNEASKALVVAEARWNEYKDDKSFAKWLSEYGKMYFKKSEEGKKLIANDLASAKFFLNNRADVIHGESLLKKIRDLKIKKFFIAGAEDGLLDEKILREDAEKGRFEFFEVEKASHFVLVDKIEEVREIIIKSFRHK